MIRWEYTAPYLFGDLEGVMDQINNLGKKGWELVQLNPSCADGGSRVFLKRMMRPPDSPMLVPDGFDARPGAINLVD